MTWRARTAAAVLGAAAIGATGLTPALAADPVGSISDDLTKVTILNINDFHGRIDADQNGKPGLTFACTVEKAKTAAGEGNYLFLSAGDNIGATPFTSSSAEDLPTVEFLNALELQASAVGNHEFDRGFTHLTDEVMAKQADFEYLGANVYEQGTQKPVLPEYYITEANGITIGVIGAVTQETPTMVSPDGVSGLSFGDPVEAVNRVAAEIDDQVDVIIAQYHEGAGGSDSLATQLAAGGVFAKIVNNTSPLVDAIFTAHTHLEYLWDGEADEGTRPVIQSSSYGGLLGKVELGVDAEGNVVQYTKANLSTSETAYADCVGDPQYDAAAKVVADAMAAADIIGKEVIGEQAADITRAFMTRADGTLGEDRLRESTMSNLTADAWLWGMNVPGRPGADIGIMNPGGVRADLLYAPGGEEAPGEITYKEAATVHPFANTMQTIDITGAQFKTLLEQQWQPEGSSRMFLKLGLSENVRYTYDPYAPSGERITGIWLDGEPMDLTAVYRIASGSFLIGGGDNFTVLQQGTNRTDSGLVDTDVFMNYVAQHSPISPNFEKNGVSVTDTALPVTATAGDEVTFTVTGVDLSSLDSPDNTSFTIYLGDAEVGTAAIESVHVDETEDGIYPTRDGQSAVAFTVPADFPGGETVITLVAEPSGTVVKVLAHITAVEPPPGEPTPPTKPGPIIETDIPAGSSGAGLLVGLALALAGAGIVLQRRRSGQH